MIDSMYKRYEHFGLHQETALTLALHIVNTHRDAAVFLIGGHYMLMHVWLNVWSELLTYADRQFYTVSTLPKRRYSLPQIHKQLARCYQKID